MKWNFWVKAPLQILQIELKSLKREFECVLHLDDMDMAREINREMRQVKDAIEIMEV